MNVLLYHVGFFSNDLINDKHFVKMTQFNVSIYMEKYQQISAVHFSVFSVMKTPKVERGPMISITKSICCTNKDFYFLSHF